MIRVVSEHKISPKYLVKKKTQNKTGRWSPHIYIREDNREPRAAFWDMNFLGLVFEHGSQN